MIALETLVRLACNDLAGSEEDAAEEHVLGCNECARTLEGLVVMGDAVRTLIATGGHLVHVATTEALVAQLDAAGLITRRYVLSPGDVAPCTVGSDDVYSLTVLHADFGGATRVDLEVAGTRVPDIAFEPDRGLVAYVVPAMMLRPLPTMKVPLRLYAFDAQGRERILGDYTLDHTAYAG